MKELRALLESLDLTDVQTYVQSGNVVFESPAAKPDSLADMLEPEIAAAFGVPAKVLLRSKRELDAIASRNPFLDDEPEHSRLHVLFLRDAPTKAVAGRLDEGRSPPDRFVVTGREIFLHYPNGSGRSKLTLDYFERTLGTVGTARNWKTVLKLRELMGA